MTPQLYSDRHHCLIRLDFPSPVFHTNYDIMHQHSHPHHHHPAQPPHSIRCQRARIGRSVSSRTRRCTRRVHPDAMVVHATTIPTHQQCHYSLLTSLLSAAGRARHRRPRVCGQAVLERLASLLGVCTGMGVPVLALLPQVAVVKGWSVRNRRARGRLPG